MGEYWRSHDNQDSEMREKARTIRRVLSRGGYSSYEDPIWKSIVDIFERSDFGRKNAWAMAHVTIPAEVSYRIKDDLIIDRVVTKINRLRFFGKLSVTFRSISGCGLNGYGDLEIIFTAETSKRNRK